MRFTTVLSIPQPCHESWAAMLPTATGRHCAACAKPVVDFTTKTDAEILAYLARAAGGRTCGRFAAGQLERPLQRAAPAAPSGRWRAWLAAVAAVWAVREGAGTLATAQVTTQWRARYWGGPVPAPSQVETGATPAAPNALPLPGRNLPGMIVLPSAVSGPVITIGMVSSQSRPLMVAPLAAAPLVLRGVITDASTNEGLPGVTVLFQGTRIGTSTTTDGSYELTVPAELATAPTVKIVVSSIGYIRQERLLAIRWAAEPQSFQMQADTSAMAGELIVGRLPPRVLPPAPWHARAFYYWGKYWLTRPFRHD